MRQDETDRELLELAAKAAGIELVWHGDTDPFCFAETVAGIKWNPLTDDGDAFRLMVKLHLLWYIGSPFEEVQINQEHNALCQATRRAIVRAAAEIGKTLP